MLRPERMSRVSVTGSKAYMDEVIETVHGLNLLHVTEYDGSWEGFEPGDPVAGADDASDKLVTVRSLESILDIEDEDAGPSRIVTEEALEEELEEIRQEVNALDDRRDDIRGELRSVEERIDQIEPFADLGIDLDLLSGYEELSVAVGEGDADEIREALARDGDVTASQVFAGEDTVAVFAYPADAPLDDVLVNTGFTAVEIPDAEGSPEEYTSELEHRRQQLESKLVTVENELEELKLDVAGFLLAAEEKLSIDVQKREAPLTFATTENAFVAEGWLPTEQFVDLAEGLQQEVGDHVEIEELERRDYEEGHPHDEGHATPAEEPVAADGGAVAGTAAAAADDETDDQAVTDGGDVTMSEEEPPVIQDNPGAIRPFEMLTEVINRPKYSEFDPTFVLFLTFPAMFGFMIGDLGYGLLYMAIGYFIYANVESDALRSLGAIALWAGAFTALFGVLYGEIFGLHQLGEIVWDGHPPMHKGLQPHYAAYAKAWLVLSLAIGLLHLAVGYLFDFVKNLSHGFVDALTESGSWMLLMFGVWFWIFSLHLTEAKPALLFQVFNRPGAEILGTEIEPGQVAYAFGFGGFPEIVGIAGLVVAALGLVLLVVGEGGVGLLESLNVLVNVLSYTRIAAVLLAKAGMAFVVNLLVFGVWVEGTGADAEWHFGLGGMPAAGEATFHGAEVAEIMFPGLIHSGALGVIFAIVVLVVGHLLVLALGITSAGLQAVRLEYVEFFGKFYEGGGKPYAPFGYERQFTTED